MFNLWAKKRVYLDFASATPVRDEARAIAAAAEQSYGNPGALHVEGVAAKKSLQESRERIARELGVKARQLIFTSGGTEGNNIAILGLARNLILKKSTLVGTHWVVSAIEHPSVLDCFGEVERLGGSVSFLDPTSHGIITPAAVSAVLRPETVCVSVQWANHEVGTIQPIREISRAIRSYQKSQGTTILLHTDCGQAPLYLSPQMHTLGVDLATLDSGKLYGPRGTGALYLSNQAELSGLLRGGGQERGLRAGTENVALIAGFAEACALAGVEREHESRRVAQLRDSLAREILARIPAAVINGELEHTLPHMLNVSIPESVSGRTSEYTTLALDHAGIAISTKSACREGEAGSSHVVAALYPDESWRATATFRFSLGRTTTDSDVARAAAALVAAIDGPHA